MKLFERNRRGVTLTAAGSAMLDEARAAARPGGAGGRPRTRPRAPARRGRLRLNLTRSLTGGLAGEIVDAYRARYPEVELELDVGNTMHPRRAAARAATIDVAFVRPPLNDPELEEVELAREPLVCVLPSGHPLAKRKLVQREELAGEPLVWWPRHHGPGPWRGHAHRRVRRRTAGRRSTATSPRRSGSCRPWRRAPA